MDNYLVINITLGIFVAGHLGITIWWASKVSTTLNFVQTELRELVTELKSIKEIYMKREDVIRELSLVEKEQKAIWKKIDFLLGQTPKEIADG